MVKKLGARLDQLNRDIIAADQGNGGCHDKLKLQY